MVHRDGKVHCLATSLFQVTITRSGGASGVMVIVVGNGHGDTSSNPGGDIAFHIALIPLGQV